MINSGLSIDTINVDSPSEEESSIERDLLVIPESFCESVHESPTNAKKNVDAKMQNKRKLYTQRTDSDSLVSLSPVSVRFSPIYQRKPVETKKKSRYFRDRSIVSRETTIDSLPRKSKENLSVEPRGINDEMVNSCENTRKQIIAKKGKQSQKTQRSFNDKRDVQKQKKENGTYVFITQKKTKEAKKKRKVISKKITVKRAAHLEELQNLCERELSEPKPGPSKKPERVSSSEGDSMNDFQSKKLLTNKRVQHPYRIVIVLTGFNEGYGLLEISI